MSAALAVVAALLALAEWIVRRREAAGKHGRDVDQVAFADALVVGCAQAAALIPGTSRSGATLLGGLMCGLTREAAARFSFLLSIPAIFAAAALEFYEERAHLLHGSIGPAKLIVALVVTAAVGYATIPWLLGFLRKRTTFVFIVYRLLLAALLLFMLFTGRIAP
jgi:undecaprenyl-diphosphatase